MASHMSELPRSLKPFGHTPYGEGFSASTSYVSEIIPDNIGFQPSSGIHELIVHEPEFVKNGKHLYTIGNTKYSYD